jgi:predicted aldo/keto reductase-like oxidoreductase
VRYRRLGKNCDAEVSILGFGTMRLPLAGERTEQIDEKTATAMLEAAVAGGINYVDTAYPYHGGESERWLGRALADGLRERVLLATKLPTWAVKTRADMDTLFEEQLERLQTDRVDVYLLHNLHGGVWPGLRELGVLEWLDKLKESGRIGYTGFSFHGEYPVFEEIVDAYDWTVAQIQYNYMNEDIQAGTKGLRYAGERGVGVVVMEPLLGGCLAVPPPLVAKHWATCPQLSPVETAFRWVWSKPQVSLALSGMSTPEQMEQNIAFASSPKAETISDDALRVIEAVKKEYNAVHTIPCTRCGYCMPCPQGVDIPRNFQLYNDAILFGGNQAILNRNLYGLIAETASANGCIGCKQCEERCPQHIDISTEMEKVRDRFA